MRPEGVALFSVLLLASQWRYRPDLFFSLFLVSCVPSLETKFVVILSLVTMRELHTLQVLA